MLTTHGLFLTCTQKFYLHIYTTHNQLFGHNPLSPSVKGERNPHLLGRLMACSWWRIPIHSGPLPDINCPPLTFQSPLTPSHPFGPYYITLTTSTISVILVQNTTCHPAWVYFTHLVIFYENDLLLFFLRIS
jgi:hypothetical protein